MRKAPRVTREDLTALIDSGALIKDIAAALGCTAKQVNRIRHYYGIQTRAEVEAHGLASAAQAAYDRMKEQAIEPGRGGDEAFAAALGGRRFGYPNPKRDDVRFGPAPLPKPAPFSGCGNAAIMCAS